MISTLRKTLQTLCNLHKNLALAISLIPYLFYLVQTTHLRSCCYFTNESYLIQAEQYQNPKTEKKAKFLQPQLKFKVWVFIHHVKSILLAIKVGRYPRKKKSWQT